MKASRFTVSLCVFHVSKSVEEISGDLGMVPEYSRKTIPMWASYWCARVVENAEGSEFEATLDKVLADLHERSSVFREYFENECRCELIVATFGGRNHGIVITARQIAALGKLYLDLGFDAYLDE